VPDSRVRFRLGLRPIGHGRARPRTRVNALRRIARETLQKITEACPSHPRRAFSVCRKVGARRGRDQAAIGRGASNRFAVRGDRARKGVVRARSRANGRQAERHGGKIGSFQGPRLQAGSRRWTPLDGNHPISGRRRFALGSLVAKASSEPSPQSAYTKV
jgi:hypothetical protein